MAFEHSIQTFSLQADESLSNKQYYFVKLTGTSKVAVCNAASNKTIGVLQNDPDANETAVIAFAGISKVSADAALTAGDLVGPSADGQADAKTPGTDTTEYIAGQVIKGVVSAGSTVSVLLGHPYRQN